MDEILVVDDEPSVVEVVSLYLKREGYAVRTADNGNDALQALREREPTLMVLDLMLPGVGGLEIMRRLRGELRLDTPVIMLTARGQEIDRVFGLELGADDYMTKPFSPVELVARIKAVLRRSRQTTQLNQKPIRYGTLIIDPNTRTVTLDETPRELTATEFNLLWFMANHPQQVFGRAQLLESVWGFSDYLDPSTVTVHIRRLREKIEENPSKPQYLQTVWGVGYKFEPGSDG